MYKCVKHGVSESVWCGRCGEICQCDHSRTGTARHKDVEFLTDDNTSIHVTFVICYCKTCNEMLGIESYD
jgi:hypothetical protein